MCEQQATGSRLLAVAPIDASKVDRAPEWLLAALTVLLEDQLGILVEVPDQLCSAKRSQAVPHQGGQMDT